MTILFEYYILINIFLLKEQDFLWIWHLRSSEYWYMTVSSFCTSQNTIYAKDNVFDTAINAISPFIVVPSKPLVQKDLNG